MKEIVKRDKCANWIKAKNFIPKEHEIILYDFPDKSIKIKVGDGKSLVSDLPFLQEEKFSSYVDGEVAYLSDDVEGVVDGRY